ncbi:MAG: Na+/H+ antiporter NhaA, partial [Hyphomonadaceae bacterium]
ASALIAVLFTSDLQILPLAAALGLLVAAWTLGRRYVLPIWTYPALALVTWVLAKESGLHTSVMAVAAALIVPPRPTQAETTLIGQLEHLIHPISAYVVLPIFAFCAAGVSLTGLGFADLAGGVSAGVAIALAVGKPLGVTLFALGAARLAQTPLPFSVRRLVIVGCLCGVGFTMSLFIGGLAFAGDPVGEEAARVGVLTGSLMSLLLAAAVHRLWPRRAAIA